VRDALVPAPPDWPAVRLRFERGGGGASIGELGGDDDVRSVGLPQGGHAMLDRARRTATLTSPQPLADDWLVHPALGFVASVFAGWMGRHCFHAGAFVVDGGAWAILGGHEAGKSSTLGWLAKCGHSIVTDDMLVLDGPKVFAGPRALDLRPATATMGAFDDRVATVRDGGRRRFATALTRPEYPLRGWFVMSWADEDGVAARRLGAGELLQALVDNMHPAGFADKAALFDLLDLPAFGVTRPKHLTSLPPTADELVRIATDTACSMR
jgi:hypothetical protein